MSIGTDPRPFDADQHYYEAPDAFQRHLPKEWLSRCVQVATIDGRVRHLVAGRVSGAVSNPTFDPIVKPGALGDYFRGNAAGKEIGHYLQDREPLPRHYQDPEPRVAVLDEQGIQSTWMLPSLGMSYEAELQFDPPAAAMTFRAFNRWLQDDWTLNYGDRIFPAPYVAMGDVPMAVEEVEWAIAAGARLLVVRPSAVFTSSGWRSPGDPIFDPIWSRINEAGVTVVVHIAETGGHELERYNQNHAGKIDAVATPLQIAIGHERPIETYLTALVCDRLFERFPRLRIASVENGASFLPRLLAGLRRAGLQRPGYFKVDPVESFRRHIWVTPFWEDDLAEVVRLIEPSRVLFGSDWPHAEGLKVPLDYVSQVQALGLPSAMDQIMRSNAAALTEPVQ